jgi:predicted ArsR family transcriptional regulator
MLRKLCDSGDEALILNQLVCYWFARDDKNCTRAQIRKAGHRWVAKSHNEWAEELGMTAKQARRCIEALAKKGFIEVRTWRYRGHNTTHVRPLTAEIARVTGCPEDQRPYRRSSRGPDLNRSERAKQQEERQVERMTRHMEALGQQYRKSASQGSN